MQQTFRIFVFKLIDLYAWIATNTNTNTNALAENKTKNLTQSGAHTKDLPAQTFLRVSQTFGTHEKTIYAAVSQHTSHSDQANKQLQTAQLTHVAIHLATWRMRNFFRWRWEEPSQPASCQIHGPTRHHHAKYSHVLLAIPSRRQSSGYL